MTQSSSAVTPCLLHRLRSGPFTGKRIQTALLSDAGTSMDQVMNRGKSDLCHVPLGCLPYLEALALQERVVALQRQAAVPDLLLTLQHPPTITIGVSGCLDDLLTEESLVRSRGIELVHTNRGGRTTYHGPGQLVAYPLIDLQAAALEPRQYIRLLERAVVRMLAGWGLTAQTIEGRRGVWIENRKIASVGIRIRARRTMHGIAINVATDVTVFSLFVPCGMRGVEMTSLERECGVRVCFDRVRHQFAHCLAKELRANLVPFTWSELCALINRESPLRQTSSSSAADSWGRSLANSLSCRVD